MSEWKAHRTWRENCLMNYFTQNAFLSNALSLLLAPLVIMIQHLGMPVMALWGTANKKKSKNFVLLAVSIARTSYLADFVVSNCQHSIPNISLWSLKIEALAACFLLQITRGDWEKKQKLREPLNEINNYGFAWAPFKHQFSPLSKAFKHFFTFYFKRAMTRQKSVKSFRTPSIETKTEELRRGSQSLGGRKTLFALLSVQWCIAGLRRNFWNQNS